MAIQAVDPALAAAFLVLFQSPQQMKDWIFNFLDIDLPIGHVDPDSNSSMIEAMYTAYEAYRDDLCLEIPGYIWLSSRDSGKTLGGSILNLILMIHFKAQISHLAAIKKQAEKSLQYCNNFVRKLKPYLEYCGRQVVTESKTKIQILNEDESVSYIDVIVATLAGGNSEHVPIATYDELETLSPQGLIGYREAKLIPTRYKGKGPLTVKFSTRKFAFGVFEQEIQDIAKTKEVLLRWNIMDITEKCDKSRHLPDLPKANRYVARSLPLRNISPEEYQILHSKDQDEYESIEAYAGCSKCPLLPVCKMRLAHRPDIDKGGFFKPINFTLRQFRILSPDMAAAQLMCWRPSQMGLVYPRFEESGNIITIAQAYERFTGSPAASSITLPDLIDYLHAKGIRFYVGGDWGHSHNQAFVVSAILPNNDWWIVDTYSVPGLEFDEILALAINIRDTYKPKMWFMDTSMPMFIKTFNKNRMPCKKFDKDVMGGIEATRKQIQDATGNRSLKIIRHDRNELAIEGIKKHHFKLDSLGNPTQDPDDSEIWSDFCDSLRYLAQNLFSPKGKAAIPTSHVPVGASDSHLQNIPSPQYSNWLNQKVNELTNGQGFEAQGKDKSGTVIWNFGDPVDD